MMRLAPVQTLRLSPGLSMAIRLMRADAAGLTAEIEAAAAENPWLVVAPPALARPWAPYWQSAFRGGAASAGADLADTRLPGLDAHVQAEIARLGFRAADAAIAQALAEALEPTGWLGRAPEAIAAETGAPLVQVLAVLARLHRVEPTGLFARSLAECLRLQAVEAGILDPVMDCLLQHLDLVAVRDITRLASLCKVAPEVIGQAMARLRRLNPKPGAGFAPGAAPVREPDLIVRRGATGWEVALNHSALPSVALAEAAETTAPGARARARALLSAIEARQGALLRLGQRLLARQAEALEHGLSYLRPMTMAEVAADLGLHETTVSRLVAGAAVDTPRGTWWLRALFGGRIEGQAGARPLSSAALPSVLAGIVAGEDPRRPLTDAALTEALAAQGWQIARRTVAKHRQAAGIPPAAARRRDRPQERPHDRPQDRARAGGPVPTSKGRLGG